MWKYDSAVGPFYIKRFDDNVYYLVYDGICYTGHVDPNMVADDFYCHGTGCAEWDVLSPGIDEPMDLSGWSIC